MRGRIRPYVPELSIRDYNTYLRYLRGVRRQLYEDYGWYACRLMRYSGVLFALLSDSLAGRVATRKRKRVPGTPCRRESMCQTQGIRQAAQVEILMGWHELQDRQYAELSPSERVWRFFDGIFLRSAYRRVVKEQPTLERLFAQEREHALVQSSLKGRNYTLASEPTSNIYGALYSTLATEDVSQRKSMRYIGSCIGRIFYLVDRAADVEKDIEKKRYNVFTANGITSQAAAVENARRQALAAANDLVRVYGLIDIKLNRTLLDNIMLLGLRHMVDPFEQDDEQEDWELP